jgi:peptidoglycan-binding protein ArfA
MAGSDEAPETTEWRRTSKFYRRRLGLPWLIGLVIIPLLLGVIGYGELDRNRTQTNRPTGALPTLSASPGPSNVPRIPALSLAPVSITRSGNNITLQGEFPSAAAKELAVNAVKASAVPNLNIVDNLRINPNITSLDFSNAGPVFKAAASIPDFALAVKGDTITLSGTAGSLGQLEAVEQAADAAWLNLNIVDTVGISSPVPSPGSSCANLQSDVKALGPIPFDANGFTLTPTAVQTLKKVANKLKACPGAKVAVNGYTDNSGNERSNSQLSENRADAVVDFLIARGVTQDRLTAKGFGAANPVADNSRPNEQAKNRRVEIVVS